MKRFLAVLLAVASVLSCTVTSYASDIYTDITETSLDEATDFLYNFDIMYGYDDDTFLPNDTLTRAELAVCVARMLGLDEQAESDKSYFLDMPADHWAAGSVAQLVQRGIFSGYGAGYFGTNDSVRTVDAAKVLVSLLGYAEVADANGGYPDGYMSVAVSAGIMDGVARTDILTRGNAAKLFFNTLNTQVALTDFQGNVAKPGKDDATFLEYYRNIMSVEGTVTSIPQTSIYGRTAYTGKIAVDDVEYLLSDIEAADLSLLGKYVSVYYEEDTDGDNVVLYWYVHEGKTEEITVNSEDIIKNETTSERLTYNDGERRKDVTIPSNAKVIYNGVALDTYTADTFKPDNGTVRLVKMKGSGKYDLIFVENAETIVVEGYESQNRILYNKIGSVLNKETDLDEYERVVIKNVVGNTLTESSLVQDAVISAYKSDCKELLTLVISSDAVSGSIGGINTENTEIRIDINGYEYLVVPEYTNVMSSQLLGGTTVTVYLDSYGKIAYHKKIQQSDMELFGYMIWTKYFEEEDKMSVKMFTSDGEIKTIDVAEKVKIDGTRYKDYAEAHTAFTNNGGDSPQLIVYKMSDEGKITYIDSVYQSTNEDDYSLSVSLTTANYYLRNGAIGRRGWFADDAIAFIVPTKSEILKGNYDDFQIKNAKSMTIKRYTTQTYKLKPNTAYETVAVITGVQTEIGNGDYPYIISKITDTINDDKEYICELVMYGRNGEVTMKTAPEIDVRGMGLKKGDVVRFATGTNGDIEVLKFIFNMANEPVMGTTANFHQEIIDGSEIKYTYGYAWSKEEDMLKVTWDLNDATEWEEAGKVSNVVVYDTVNNEIYMGDINDIRTHETTSNCSKIFFAWHMDGLGMVMAFN